MVFRDSHRWGPLTLNRFVDRKQLELVLRLYCVLIERCSCGTRCRRNTDVRRQLGRNVLHLRVSR